MSTPIPPSITAILTTSGGSATPTITIPNPPAALTVLPPGSSLQATVAALQSGNQVQLTTALGALLGQANVTLKPNQAVTLNILPQPPSAKSVALQIIALAGKPVAPATTGNAGLAGGQAAANPATAPANVTLSAGQTVIATVIKPLTSATAPTPAFPTSTPGPANAAPTNIANPGSPLTPTTGNAAPQPGHSPATPTQITGTTQPTAAAPPPAGALLKLTIVNVNTQPTGAPTLTPSGPTPTVGQSFIGTVSGATSSGQPTVQTPLGTIAIDNAPPMAKGAEITFKLETSPFQPSQSVSLGFGEAREGLVRGHHWRALDELTSALAERSPAFADRITNMLTPRPDAKLGTSLLFLLSALKGGDLKSWIGETAMRELDRIRPDMLRRLGDDVRFIASDGDDGDGRAVRPTGDWRSIPLPLFGEGMDQSRLLVRRDGGEETEDNEKRKETRFVVDLTLTSIGRLQLDGLIDPSARRFDMLVRTTASLPPRFRQDILQIFAASNETIGLNGGLTFRATPDALIDTTDATAPERDGSLII